MPRIKKSKARKGSNTVKTDNLLGEIEFKLTPRAEAFNLAAHGTKAAVLSPRNLIQAAELDLRTKERNRLVRNASPGQPLFGEPLLPYAFGEHVVHNTSCVAHLLAKALAFRPVILALGIEDEKKREKVWRKLPLSTFRVYQGADILAQAAEMAAVSEQVAA